MRSGRGDPAAFILIVLLVPPASPTAQLVRTHARRFARLGPRGFHEVLYPNREGCPRRCGQSHCHHASLRRQHHLAAQELSSETGRGEISFAEPPCRLAWPDEAFHPCGLQGRHLQAELRGRREDLLRRRAGRQRHQNLGVGLDGKAQCKDCCQTCGATQRRRSSTSTIASFPRWDKEVRTVYLQESGIFSSFCYCEIAYSPK